MANGKSGARYTCKVQIQTDDAGHAHTHLLARVGDVVDRSPERGEGPRAPPDKMMIRILHDAEKRKHNPLRIPEANCDLLAATLPELLCVYAPLMSAGGVRR